MLVEIRGYPHYLIFEQIFWSHLIGTCGLPIIMCVEFGCVEKIAVMKIYYGKNLYIYNTRVGLSVDLCMRLQLSNVVYIYSNTMVLYVFAGV